jgi:lysozyme
MQINAKGLELLKSFEGCKLTAYRDQAGVLTIGYGCTRDVVPGMTITQEEAEERLQQDLLDFEEGVSKLLTIEVSNNQFSALVCFAYNLGLGALKKSHLLSFLNQGMIKKASTQFVKWDLVNGMPDKGILRRREAERDLFLS